MCTSVMAMTIAGVAYNIQEIKLHACIAILIAQ